MAKIKTKRERVKFASDNVAGACPEVLDAIIKANDGDSTPYGNDQISTELQDKFSEIFEKEVIVFPTASGTAANALALSTMTPSFGNIYCHKMSHINTDECGAPEFYTGGGKLVPLTGIMGKITAEELTQSGSMLFNKNSLVQTFKVCCNNARLGTATRIDFGLIFSAIQNAVKLLPVPQGIIILPRSLDLK